MPKLADKEICSGCAACANACPTDCISMKADETGFLFPVFDSSKCINCKKCERACPALENRKSEYCKQGDGKRFVVQNKSEKILLESTSGGAFTAFAEQIIVDGGVVFGACMGDDFHVRHTYATDLNELGIFRNSKYVQSEIGHVYRECLDFLENGRIVLFSGTPCQIVGLKKFLGKEYDNLILVDVICHAVPSPKLFQKYIELCKMRFPGLKKIVFRDKAFGYSYTTMSIYYEKNKKIEVSRKSRYFDEWYRLFFGGYCNREVCYLCPFQFGVRKSDITIWDCYEAHNLAPNLNNNKGATNIVIWTEKGNTLLSKVQDKLLINEVEFDPMEKGLYREELFKKDVPNIYKDAEKLSVKAFFNKYTPCTTFIYMCEILRKILLVLGIHDFVRNIIHKIRRNKKI